MILLDGKKAANEIKDEIKKEVLFLKKKHNITPHLVAILVGSDPASKTYVMHKVAACKYCGIDSSIVELYEGIEESVLLNKVIELNNRKSVHGIIVQLPLPKHIDSRKVTNTISPEKDVDGFHPLNVGKTVLGLPSFLPATPKGIVELLRRYSIQTKGKKCVVLGRSQIVGLPISILLGQKGDYADCTVTLVHSKTENIEEEIRQADILIAAIGKPGYVKKVMLKKDAVVVDVGISRVDNPKAKKGYTLMGDVDFDDVKDVCSYITPVPGGVGPMTVVSLLQNTLSSAKGLIS